MAKSLFSIACSSAASFIAGQGRGFLIWYAILIVVGCFDAFISVYDPTLFFFFGFFVLVIGPIVIGVGVIPPLWAIVKAIRRLMQGSYRSAIVFGMVPIIGFGCLVLPSRLLSSVLTAFKIASYQSSIEAARANGSKVAARDVKIDLGPPIVAHFVQPTMMWDAWEIVYVQDDDISRVSGGYEEICGRVIQPLGSHFYSVRGTC